MSAEKENAEDPRAHRRGAGRSAAEGAGRQRDVLPAGPPHAELKNLPVPPSGPGPGEQS